MTVIAGGPGQPYVLSVDTHALQALIGRFSGPMGDAGIQHALQDAVRKWGALVQARAVRNVTGYPVVYEGGVFRVMVRTGTLRGSIELQWPYEHHLQARVYVNGTAMNPGSTPGTGGARPRSVAEYAGAIEWGHGEIDLKKHMQGKVVPFFGARGVKARGPYAATGLEPSDPGATGYGSRWKSQVLNAKLQAKGKEPMTFEKKGGNAAYAGAKKGASTYFIAFRTVGKKGWVIPEAKPRPFMRAALDQTKDQGRIMFTKAIVAELNQT